MGGCYSSFFDRNGDGNVSAQEVFLTGENSLKLLLKLSTGLATVLVKANLVGLDTGPALDILKQVNAVAEESRDAVTKLKDVKIPSSFQEIGDVNGDGKIDELDALALIELASSHQEGIVGVARSVVAALNKAGVDTTNLKDVIAKTDEVLTKLNQLKAVDEPVVSAARI